MLEQLERLERELHKPSVRCDENRLTELLHPGFREFGKNGRDYCFDQIVEELSEEDDSLQAWSGGYTLQYSTPESALILYRSAHINQDGSVSSFALRSSLWVKDGEKWKMLFHQGTRTAPFDLQSI